MKEKWLAKRLSLAWRMSRSNSFTRNEFLHPKISLSERMTMSDFSSEDGLLMAFHWKRNNRDLFPERHRYGSFLETTHRKLRFLLLKTSFPAHSPSLMVSLSSNAGVHLCDTCISSLCSQCRSTVLRSSDLPKDPTPNRTGSSSHSIESSDSAFYDQRLLDLNDGLSHQNHISDTLL